MKWTRNGRGLKRWMDINKWIESSKDKKSLEVCWVEVVEGLGEPSQLRQKHSEFLPIIKFCKLKRYIKNIYIQVKQLSILNISG